MIRRLLCRLGMHGPEWGGHGMTNLSRNNASVGPGHRRCAYCGAEWIAYEGVSRGPYRVLEWARVPSKGV